MLYREFQPASSPKDRTTLTITFELLFQTTLDQLTFKAKLIAQSKAFNYAFVGEQSEIRLETTAISSPCQFLATLSFLTTTSIWTYKKSN